MFESGCRIITTFECGASRNTSHLYAFLFTSSCATFYWLSEQIICTSTYSDPAEGRFPCFPVPGRATLFLEGEIFRSLTFSRTKFGKRMSAHAPCCPRLLHCTAASSPHNRFEINHQGRTDPPSVLLGAVAAGAGVSTFYAISSIPYLYSPLPVLYVNHRRRDEYYNANASCSVPMMKNGTHSISG